MYETCNISISKRTNHLLAISSGEIPPRRAYRSATCKASKEDENTTPPFTIGTCNEPGTYPITKRLLARENWAKKIMNTEKSMRYVMTIYFGPLLLSRTTHSFIHSKNTDIRTVEARCCSSLKQNLPSEFMDTTTIFAAQ